MYKANKGHLQPPLISTVNDLPEKLRKRLEQSWAGDFYRETFRRIKEELFKPLYADEPSRPNVAVNVLVGLDLLKERFGWSDEELYDNFSYDLQVRYALGYHNLNEGEFDLRTLYYFRDRTSRYYLETGINLLGVLFKDLTGKQIEAYQLNTRVQRMDSTQIMSNIVDASRLRLLVEGLQRLQRILGGSDQVRYTELLAPYLGKTSGQYVYRIKGREMVQTHLQQIGQVLAQLVQELQASYADAVPYQVVKRLFEDNFTVVERLVEPKPNEALSSSCLQSVDDLEATYHRKGREDFKGYVLNLSETCHPDNPLQLITQVQVAPNNQADSTLLAEGLADLKQRTGVETLYTDGCFGSMAADRACLEQNVELVQTGIRGNEPAADKFSLADFEIQQADHGQPRQITCPHGQSVPVEPGRTTGFIASFDPLQCQACPFHQEHRCRAQPQKKNPAFKLSFTQEEVNWARRRRRHRAFLKEGKNPRAAVEATVRSIKHPFPGGKMPVRGRFRVTYLAVASAIMVNSQRIHRYLSRRAREAIGQSTSHKRETASPEAASSSFFSDLPARWFAFLNRFIRQRTCFGF